MKTLSLLVILLTLTLSAWGDSGDINQLREKGYIVVVDSHLTPIEVQIDSAGKTIICFSEEKKNRKYYIVLEEMFPVGQYSILLLCIEGGLLISNGYV